MMEIRALLVKKRPGKGESRYYNLWPIVEIRPEAGKDTYDITVTIRDPWTYVPIAKSANNVREKQIEKCCAIMIIRALNDAYPKLVFTWDYDVKNQRIIIDYEADDRFPWQELLKEYKPVVTCDRTFEENNTMRFTKVVVNGPATIAWVTTGRNPAKKVVIKKADGDIYDLEKAMLMCWVKSWFSDDTDFHKWFKLNMKMFEEAYEASKAKGDSIENAYPNCYNGQEIANNINDSLDRLSERLKVAANRLYSSGVYGIKAKDKKGADWSWDEVSFLNRHYSTKSVKHIAMVLGRSEAAVRAKARKLGIKRGGNTNDI